MQILPLLALLLVPQEMPESSVAPTGLTGPGPAGLDQDAAPAGDGTAAVLAAAPEQARALWTRLVAATGGGTNRAPITAFQVKANGLRREGVQTNELYFDYSYLAPDCIRFAIDGDKESGRFGTKARDYWVRTPDGVQTLTGRNYADDRDLVKEMHAIARNFVSLSDPARLRLTGIELLAEPPLDLDDKLRRSSKRMPWLRVASPDFALFTDQVSTDGKDRRFQVDLALHIDGPAVDLPRYAIVRELTTEGKLATAPMFIRLDRFEDREGFRVPHRIFVHALEAGLDRAIFGAKPQQEVYILEANLRPELTVEDFKPGE